MEQNLKQANLKSKNLLLDNCKQVDEALRKAFNHALLENKRAGNAVAVWRDGKVVLIPPDEIVVEEN